MEEGREFCEGENYPPYLPQLSHHPSLANSFEKSTCSCQKDDVKVVPRLPLFDRTPPYGPKDPDVHSGRLGDPVRVAPHEPTPHISWDPKPRQPSRACLTSYLAGKPPGRWAYPTSAAEPSTVCAGAGQRGSRGRDVAMQTTPSVTEAVSVYMYVYSHVYINCSTDIDVSDLQNLGCNYCAAFSVSLKGVPGRSPSFPCCLLLVWLYYSLISVIVVNSLLLSCLGVNTGCISQD